MFSEINGEVHELYFIASNNNFHQVYVASYINKQIKTICELCIKGNVLSLTIVLISNMSTFSFKLQKLLLFQIKL